MPKPLKSSVSSKIRTDRCFNPFNLCPHPQTRNHKSLRKVQKQHLLASNIPVTNETLAQKICNFCRLKLLKERPKNMNNIESELNVKTEIRTELSKMSFEELQKLKEKLGSKVYNEAMFGTRAARRTIFKRDNKNRPREISAKKQVPRFKEVVHVKKTIPRDPRFDSLCGTFNEKVFKNSYSFLHEIKKNDLATLNEKLKNNTKDPKTVKKIKYLIQRLENQLREEEKRKQKEEQQQKEKQEIIQAIKSGEKPNFKKKSEKRILNLVSQFEELKNSGKLKRHIRRMRKRNVGREIRKLEESTSE